MRGMDLPFTRDHLPAKFQIGNPDGYAIYHYFAFPIEHQKLEDHRQEYLDVLLEFGVVQAGSSFFLSHMLLGKTRKQSSELR